MAPSVPRLPLRPAAVAGVVLAAAFVAASALVTVRSANAQCVSCGNPAFASGNNDISRSLNPQSAQQYGVQAGFVYGYGSSNSYFDGDKETTNFDDFDMTMNLFTLAAGVTAPWGTELATVLPFGQLASTRRFNEAGAEDKGLGDLEVRLRQDIMAFTNLRGGLAPRIVLSLGVVAPTGLYVAKQTEEIGTMLDPGFGGGFGGGTTGGGDTSDAGVDSSKYLSIGRGAWWMVADLEAFGRVHERASYYVGVAARRTTSDAPDGFRWGDELRTTVGLNGVAVQRWLNVSVQGEYQWRGRSTEVIIAERLDFLNGGGDWISLMPTLQSQVLPELSVSVSGRFPLYRNVVGVQAVQNASIWLSVTGNFGFGGDTRDAASPALGVAKGAGTPAMKPGDAPSTPEIRALLVPGKVTVVDYWASWCKPCQKLGVVINEWRDTKPANVELRKFDASDWQKEHWLKYLPHAPTLPVLDIYDAAGKLIARLSGDEAFRFVDHLPK